MFSRKRGAGIRTMARGRLRTSRDHVVRSACAPRQANGRGRPGPTLDPDVHISATDPSPAGRPRLLTLGGLTLTNGVQPSVGAAAQRRPLALLAVLARAGERG